MVWTNGEDPRVSAFWTCEQRNDESRRTELMYVYR